MPKRNKKQASENGQKRRPVRSGLKKTFGPLAPVGRGAKKASHYVIPPYFRNSWNELKLVTWPNWTLSRQLTVAVIIFAVIFAVLIGLVDWGLDHAFKALFLK